MREDGAHYGIGDLLKSALGWIKYRAHLVDDWPLCHRGQSNNGKELRYTSTNFHVHQNQPQWPSG